MSFKLLVFISGTGSNLEAILNHQKQLNVQVTHVVSNKSEALGLEKAKNNNVSTSVFAYDKKSMTRQEYDRKLAEHINETVDFDILVLAGWMHILGREFLSKVSKPIVNLHPALPDTFTGANGIEDTYNAYQKDKNVKAGVMSHYVVEEVDRGEVLSYQEVPIFSNDTLETLRERVRYYEKNVLFLGIQKCCQQLQNNTFVNPNQYQKYPLIYTGKVRNVYDIGYNMLSIETTDRQSSFDRHICNIPRKGQVLTHLATWWFKQTGHIVPNHYLYSYDNVMVVKRCRAFPIEVIVRGFITGSTQTSLWTHYKNGARNYCGHNFPDGLVKNQRLPQAVVTPTTKGEVDELITGDEIVNQNLLTREQWDYVERKALELFSYGQYVSDQRGLILVDTKYEFGFDEVTGEICLIDEIHTCDSSRFWLKESYQERFDNRQEPEKYDKDLVRDYVKKQCDPYNEPIPEIPEVLIDGVSQAYQVFNFQLTGGMNDPEKKLRMEEVVDLYFRTGHNKTCLIMAGSESDRKHINKLHDAFKTQGIYSYDIVASAHKKTQEVVNILEETNGYHKNGRQMCMVAVAGRSNALGGVLAANSNYPVISCPPFKDKVDMFTNINSSLQNPSKVPAAVILDPGNVALFVKKMFN